MNRWTTALAALLSLSIATPALAARVNERKIKKWPEEDRVLARSFDVWMSDDEFKVFEKIKTTEERRSFLEQAGYMKMWENIEDEIMPHVMKGDVVKGMSQDEVYMVWDKPTKIRKDFKKDAYVDVLYYQFEIDRKGNEFLSWPESPTAYKNEVITRYVYMYDGQVFRVVDAGQEEGVLDELVAEQERLEAERDAAKPVVDIEDVPEWADEGVEIEKKTDEDGTEIEVDDD